MDDALCLQRYATYRDAEAFAALVRHYENLVYAVCRRCLGVRASSDVDEAVQETFIKLARSAGSVRGESLAAWLHRCAVNNCLDLLRRARSRINREQAYARQMARIKSEAADTSEILREVDAAIDTLAQGDRELIVGYFFQRQTQEELAQRAGLTQSGIQRGLQRAIERLREKLHKQGVAVATAAALTAGLQCAEAQAQVPAALGAGLMKIGLSGVGPTAVQAASGGGWAGMGLAGKVAAALVVGVTLTAGTVGVVKVVNNSGSSAGAGIGSPALAAMSGDEQAGVDPALVGRWRQRGRSVDGRLLGVSFEGRRMIVHQLMNDQMAGGTFELEVVRCDPTVKPMEMDLKLVRLPDGFPDQRQLGTIMPFIYRIKDSRLEMAGAAPGRDKRPTEFQPGDGVVYVSAPWYGPEAAPAEEHSLGADGVDEALKGQWAELDQQDEIRITDDNHVIVEDDDGNVIVVCEISNRSNGGAVWRFDLTYIQHPDPNRVDMRVPCAYTLDAAGVMRVAMHVPVGQNPDKYPTDMKPARGLFISEYERIP